MLALLSGCSDSGQRVEASVRPSLWQSYCELFVAADGRVIDTGNDNISHSEGQGYGMLFAVHQDDRTSFNKMWNWTRRHLQNRPDGLFIWKWLNDELNPVPDINNATDGDLLIAWALLRASIKWDEPSYQEEALRIIRMVRRLMIADSPVGPLLLPGADGFIFEDSVVVNPSYWLFPAFIDFHRVDPSVVWVELILSGQRLMRNGGFGKWSLPPDWLGVKKTTPPEFFLPENFDPVHGYNAVRVPLNMVWGGLTADDLFKPYEEYVRAVSGIQNLRNIVQLDQHGLGDYGPMEGLVAVYDLLVNRSSPRTKLDSVKNLEKFDRDTAYFSASLLIMAEIARQEAPIYRPQLNNLLNSR